MFMTARKVHKRCSYYKGTVLATDLEELITRDSGRPMGYPEEGMNISRTTVRKMVSEDMRKKIL